MIKHSDTLSHGFIRCLLSPFELPQVTFGSTSEGLKCVAAHDMGDFDLMLFSSREEMLLNVDRLHDIPECPGFVHIHGVGHPALKDCLYQDTEYVAISALKDFHPSVFREASAFLQNSSDVDNDLFISLGFPNNVHQAWKQLPVGTGHHHGDCTVLYSNVTRFTSNY